jgi:hypothetical protein
MKSYPLTQELRQAIERLFDDPSMALTPLGANRTDPSDCYVSGADPSLPPQKRAVMLRTKLEQFIKQMADEHEEMGSSTATDTLRMQAVGILLALRELWLHFPEIETTAEVRNASGN